MFLPDVPVDSNSDVPPPLTEDEIRASTVGELAPHRAAIDLAEYDPQWPLLFEREEQRIRAALGERALRVEHVGSTSGARARGEAADRHRPRRRRLERRGRIRATARGFRLRAPDSRTGLVRAPGPQKGPDTNVNVHTFSDGCSEVGRMLAFRDWLCTHDDDRKLYETAKRELAGREWKYVQNYADAKSEVVEEILARARPRDT